MEKVYRIDGMKFFAIIAIFFIHFSVFQYFQGDPTHPLYLFFNSVSRFAVPFFFIVAGYFFHHKVQQQGWRYTQRYISKIVLMYVSWVLIYMLAIGYSYGNWQPVSILTLLYHGTAGAEIMWFLPALIWSILAVYIAQRFKRTTTLLAIASVLYAIGLCGQGIQIFFETPWFSSSHQFFKNSRDPLFFALFYVTLGYQCSQWSLQSWSQKKPQGLWLAIALIGSLMTFAECYFLIKSQGMRVPVDYYFSTIIVTVALLAWCLSKVTQQPTRFSALGQHSGEIYLNHGIVQIALTSLIYLMGFYTIPEKQQFFANTVWLQVLMVPVALSLNLTGYFAIRWLALHLCGKSAVKQYRYSAMLITISIMLCFSFGAGMQHPPVVTSWAVINQVILGIAIILGITLLSMWYNQNKMWQVPLIGTVIASGVTVMALLTGYIEWSFSLLDMSKGSVSIFEALKAPVFPILPFVIGLILFNLTIYRIVDWQFTRNQERRQLHA